MLRMKVPARALAWIGVSALVVGCDAGSGEGFALVGAWTDDFGGSHVITEASWTMTSEGIEPALFAILTVDDGAGWLSAENDATNAYAPGLFSRFDWTTADSDLRFCQTVYDAATQQDAEAATPADAADLDGGCNGFAWSTLVPAE